MFKPLLQKWDFENSSLVYLVFFDCWHFRIKAAFGYRLFSIACFLFFCWFFWIAWFGGFCFFCFYHLLVFTTRVLSAHIYFSYVLLTTAWDTMLYYCIHYSGWMKGCFYAKRWWRRWCKDWLHESMAMMDGWGSDRNVSSVYFFYHYFLWPFCNILILDAEGDELMRMILLVGRLCGGCVLFSSLEVG